VAEEFEGGMGVIDAGAFEAGLFEGVDNGASADDVVIDDEDSGGGGGFGGGEGLGAVEEGGEEVEGLGDRAEGGGVDVFGFFVELLEQGFEGGAEAGYGADAGDGGVTGDGVYEAVEFGQGGQSGLVVFGLEQGLEEGAELSDQFGGAVEEGSPEIGCGREMIGGTAGGGGVGGLRGGGLEGGRWGGVEEFTDDFEELFWGAAGLDEALVGAGVPGFLDEAAEVGVCEDDDREGSGLGLGADLAEYVDAVDAGEHEVEDEEVGFEFGDGAEAGFAVAGEGGMETFREEAMAIDVTDDLIVFDDENALHAAWEPGGFRRLSR
jgi:hypothetical protein